MSGKYAKKTSVNTEKTRMQIEKTIIQYGADGFSSGWDGPKAYIAFRIQGRSVKFSFHLPDKNNDEFIYTPSKGLARTEKAAYEAWEQACRSSWRSLALFIKATLEAIEIGILSFDEAFLPYLITQSGQTISELIIPQIPKMLGTGKEDDEKADHY